MPAAKRKATRKGSDATRNRTVSQPKGRPAAKTAPRHPFKFVPEVTEEHAAAFVAELFRQDQIAEGIERRVGGALMDAFRDAAAEVLHASPPKVDLRPLALVCADELLRQLGDTSEFDFFMEAVRPDLRIREGIPDDVDGRLNPEIDAYLYAQKAAERDVIGRMRKAFLASVVDMLVVAAESHLQSPTPAIRVTATTTPHAGHWLNRATHEGRYGEIVDLALLAIKEGGDSERYRAAGFTDLTLAEIVGCELCLGIFKAAALTARFPKEARDLLVRLEATLRAGA